MQKEDKHLMKIILPVLFLEYVDAISETRLAIVTTMDP